MSCGGRFMRSSWQRKWSRCNQISYNQEPHENLSAILVFTLLKQMLNWHMAYFFKEIRKSQSHVYIIWNWSSKTIFENTTLVKISKLILIRCEIPNENITLLCQNYLPNIVWNKYPQNWINNGPHFVNDLRQTPHWQLVENLDYEVGNVNLI